MNVRRVALAPRAGRAGRVFPLEEGAELPFRVRRAYFIRDVTPGAVAGRHAHRRTEAVFVCVQGRCALWLEDGRERVRHALEVPDEALYVGRMIWREVTDFTPDCVLLVLASEPYDPADYIHDRAEFLSACRGGP